MLASPLAVGKYRRERAALHEIGYAIANVDAYRAEARYVSKIRSSSYMKIAMRTQNMGKSILHRHVKVASGTYQQST